MKKILVAIAIALAVAGCSERTPAERTWNAEVNYKAFIPLEAKILEVVPVSGNYALDWAIFEFRGQCFLIKERSHAGFMANIDCNSVKR